MRFSDMMGSGSERTDSDTAADAVIANALAPYLDTAPDAEPAAPVEVAPPPAPPLPPPVTPAVPVSPVQRVLPPEPTVPLVGAMHPQPAAEKPIDYTNFADFTPLS